MVIALPRIKDSYPKKSYFVKIAANTQLVINTTWWTCNKFKRSAVTKSLPGQFFRTSGTGGLGGAKVKTTGICNPQREASQKAGPVYLQTPQSFF